MSSPIVVTPSGRVRGCWDGDVAAFKGIPYGAATSGPDRFLPPREVEPWSAPLDATEFGPTCPQIAMAGSGRRIAGAPSAFAGFDDPYPDGEDCLVLNVWTPRCDDLRRPVMVWLHGGGLHAGTGSSPLYDGAALAQRGDVVVVTLNHRLGILGHLHLGQAFGGAYQSAAMVGLLDIVAALGWVNTHIERFGGDPGNVTIFGQSGGGQKVTAVISMPASGGLVHRAIAQSGSMTRAGSRMDQVELAAFALERLGVREGDVEALQTLRLDRIIDVAVDISDRFGKMVFDGAVDGVALPAHPVEMLRSGLAARVPLMIGTTANEFRGGIAETLAISDEGLVDMLSNVIGRRDTGNGAREPLALYRREFPAMSNARAFGEIFTDYAHANAIAVAEAKHAGGGAPVYMYLYAAGRARHCDELPYLFRWGQDGNLADIMSDTWLTFARTGNPNQARIPHWEPYSPDDRSTMILGETPQTETDPVRHARLRWDRLSVAGNPDRTG